MSRTKTDRSWGEAVEEILSKIIDEWYERVSGYYVTSEEATGNSPAQLKRFHDSKGHRIKFNKDDLDFTYGLRCSQLEDGFAIEISVNNKVENFDYDDFRHELSTHYHTAGARKVTTPASLRKFRQDEVLQLESGISEALSLERRPNKADIMRLAFKIRPDCVQRLLRHRLSTKKLIESYCVSPFRSAYANVYRRKSD